MELRDPHLYRPDRVLLWNAIADRVESDPDCLEIPLANIERWMARGRVNDTPLLEWRRRIHAAQADALEMKSFIEYLRAENHDSEPLKSCSPFPGLLSKQELDQCFVDRGGE